MAVAGTTAVSFVALTYVVVSPVVPNMTCAPLTKPVPLAVRVNCAPPLFAEVGLKLVSVGAAVTVKFAVVDGAPPGFCTEMALLPPAATRPGGDRCFQLS